MATLDQIDQGLALAAKNGDAESVRALKAARDSMLSQKPASAPQVSRPSPNMLADVLKSAGTGLMKGVTGIAGLPGDIRAAETWLLDKLPGGKMAAQFRSEEERWVKSHGLPNVLTPPTSEQINKSVQKVIGPYYSPQTTPAKYAETLASFVPGGVMGKGSMVKRAITDVAAPAIASETAGELAQGTPFEAPARAIGAVIGGGMGAKAVRGKETAEAIKAAPSLEDLKIAKNKFYDDIKTSGITIRPHIFDKFANAVKGALSDADYYANAHGDVKAIVNEIDDIKNNPVSLNRLDKLRSRAASITADPTQKNLGRVVVEKIDDLMSSLPKNDIVEQARSFNRRASVSQKIQTAIENAKREGGVTNLDERLRAEFKKLANNKRDSKYFTPEELDAVKTVAYGEPGQNINYAIGKLAPSKSLLGGGIGAAELMAILSGHPQAAIAALAPAPSKIASALKSSSNAKIAEAMARGAKIPAKLSKTQSLIRNTVMAQRGMQGSENQ